MRNLLLTISTVILFSISAAATQKASPLDGRTFCRTIKVEPGFFGQPAGMREHCVSFNGRMMRDNANTFFGNPPSQEKYKLIEGAIFTESKQGIWEQTSYTYANNEMKYGEIALNEVK